MSYALRVSGIREFGAPEEKIKNAFELEINRHLECVTSLVKQNALCHLGVAERKFLAADDLVILVPFARK